MRPVTEAIPIYVRHDYDIQSLLWRHNERDGVSNTGVSAVY